MMSKGGGALDVVLGKGALKSGKVVATVANSPIEPACTLGGRYNAARRRAWLRQLQEHSGGG